MSSCLQRWWGVLAVAAGATLSAPSSARQCLNGPLDVPGLNGAPVWLGAPGATDWRPELDDPRWAGSPVRLFPFNDGAGDEAQYRVLYSGGKIYVTIQVLNDPLVTDFADAVYFGFTRSGTGADVVKIAPDRTTPSVVGPAAVVPHDATLPVKTDDSVETADHTGYINGYVNWYSTPDATASAPVWSAHSNERPMFLSNLATWNGSPVVKWAVSFIVDPGQLAGPFRIFVGTHVQTSTGAPGQSVTLASSSYETVAANAVGGVTIVPKKSVNNVDASMDWLELDDPAAGCATGISVSASMAGVLKGASLTNAVETCNVDAGSCPISNVFQVKVEGVPNGVGSPYGIRARFRFADWKTTADPFASWKPIATTSGTIFTDDEATFSPACVSSSCKNGGWSWAFAPGASSGEATLAYSCSSGPGESSCPVLGAGATPHQSMIVELAGSPLIGTDVTFRTSAIYFDVNYSSSDAAGADAGDAAADAGHADAGSADEAGDAEVSGGGQPDAQEGSTAQPPDAHDASGQVADAPPASTADAASGAADAKADGCSCRVGRPADDAAAPILVGFALFGCWLRRYSPRSRRFLGV